MVNFHLTLTEMAGLTFQLPDTVFTLLDCISVPWLSVNIKLLCDKIPNNTSMAELNVCNMKLYECINVNG